MITNDRSGVQLANPLCDYRGNVESPGIVKASFIPPAYPGTRLADVSGNILVTAKGYDLVAIDTDANAFIIAAGITDAVIKTGLSNLVRNLKLSSLWSKFDAVYPFVGGTSASCALNLVNPALYQITWNGGMSFSKSGATGDGSSGYGATGFIPSSATTPKYTLNSASLGIGLATLANLGASPFAIGAWNFGGLGPSSYLGFNGGTDGMAVSGPNCGSAVLNVGGNILGNWLGLCAITRTDAATTAAFRGNGTKFSTGFASTAVNTLNLTLFALNVNNSLSSYFQGTLNFAFIGSSLSDTDYANLRTHVNTFNTSIPR